MKRIAITGAAGAIAYSFLFRLAEGNLFGDEKIILHLIDLPGMEKALEGVAMELDDCAFPLLHDIVLGSDIEKLFKQVDIALLLGARPRSSGMERSDLLTANAQIFVDQGRALNQYAKKDVKVIVVGNPCNTNCLIALHQASHLKKENFHAMMLLDQNRASSFVSKKTVNDLQSVDNITIWGNHSATQVPDLFNATIGGRAALDVIADPDWSFNEFMKKVQNRGSAIIKARGHSSSASAANALFQLLKCLYTKTAKNAWFSSAVYSQNNPYGLDENLIFGLPCRSDGLGGCQVVPDLSWDNFLKEKIALTQQELIAERESINSFLN